MADFSTVQLPKDQEVAWYDLVGKFKSYANQFAAAQNDLAAKSSAVANTDPDTQAAYQALVTRAADVQSKIESIRAGLTDIQNALAGAYDAVSGVAQTLWGVNATPEGTALAAEQVVQYHPEAISQPISTQAPTLLGIEEDENFGLLPLIIPFAAIAASIAVIAYFLNDYAQFSKRLSTMQQLQSQGVPVEQAAQIVSKIAPAPVGFGAAAGKTIGTGLLIAAAVGFGYWYFFMRKGKR